jgi:arylsulfatase B
MRKNMTVDLESSGVYATNHFSAAAEGVIEKHNTDKPLFLIVNHLAPHTANENDPMQAPEEEIQKFSYIKNEKRRILAGT